jgi:hypothetical protein
MTAAEITNRIKTALRKQFPRHKFSVTGGGEYIRWTDDGPTKTEVEDTIIATGLVEIQQYDDKRYLKLPDIFNHIWLDRYNEAKRVAGEQERERRAQEEAALAKRQQEAVSQAWKAKRQTVTQAGPYDWLKQPQQKSDQSVFAAFDRLRERAELSTNLDEEGDERTRRPSCAPPLILGEELAVACLELGYLTEDDKWIGRLWAHFASPERKARYYRQNVSKHPLRGISCRGFQLFAGSTRQSVGEILFEAQREESGEWRFGPLCYPAEYSSPRQRQWEDLIRVTSGLNFTQNHRFEFATGVAAGAVE